MFGKADIINSGEKSVKFGDYQDAKWSYGNTGKLKNTGSLPKNHDLIKSKPRSLRKINDINLKLESIAKQQEESRVFFSRFSAALKKRQRLIELKKA